MKLSNGKEVKDFTGDELTFHKSLFHGVKSGLVRIGEHDVILPSHYKNMGQKYLDFEMKESDVVILTYPKCGTTWTQEIVWTMCHNPNLDNPDFSKNVSFRAPFIEFDSLFEDIAKITGPNPSAVEELRSIAPNVSPNDEVFLKLAENVPDRRIIKTHLPFTLMPENMLHTSKVIYVARNPKDAVVSYLHHSRIIKVHDYKGTDEQFVDLYCQGDLIYGSYEKHLLEAWQRKNDPNLLILFFEDMKKDIVAELKKIDSFLGTQLTDTQINNVAKHTSFSSMKGREPKRISENTEEKSGNKDGIERKNSSFYRKGEAGSWKSDLDPTLSKKIDDWVEQKLNPTVDFKFNFCN